MFTGVVSITEVAARYTIIQANSWLLIISLSIISSFVASHYLSGENALHLAHDHQRHLSQKTPRPLPALWCRVEQECRATQHHPELARPI